LQNRMEPISLAAGARQRAPEPRRSTHSASLVHGRMQQPS
jgi:hypothetical protein